MTIAVAEVVNQYLPLTQTFLYGTLTHLTAVRPVVLAAGTENLEAFPFDDMIVVEPGGRGASAVDAVARRLTGRRPVRERRYADAFRQTGAAVIHGHFGWSAPNTLPLKREFGLPLVTTFYGADMSALPRVPEWQRIYAELFVEGDLFLVEGSHMAQSLARLGCPRERIAIQHIGVDTEAIRFAARSAPADGETRILMCGAFREKKGIRYGIEAFARVAGDRTDVRLVLAGDGPDRSMIERLIDDLAISDRVELVGFVTHQRFHQLAREAHLFMAPSCTADNGDTEGGAPTVLIEAQAAGLPVISTFHADIPEVVRDGVSGVLVPEHDSDALATALDEMLNRPYAWPDMGDAGRQHVVAEYDLGVLARQLEATYLSVANGTGSHQRDGITQWI